MKTLLAALLILPALAHAEEDRSWILLQRQANGGIGSLSHDLTEHECTLAKTDIQATVQKEAARSMFTFKGWAMYKQAIRDSENCSQTVLLPFDDRPSGMDVNKSASETTCLIHNPAGEENEMPIIHHDTDITSADCFQ